MPDSREYHGHAALVGSLDDLGVEVCRLEDFRIGLERDTRSVSAERADLFELIDEACKLGISVSITPAALALMTAVTPPDCA